MPHLILEFGPTFSPKVAQDLSDRLVTALATIRRPDGSHEFPPNGTLVRGYIADVMTLGGAGANAAFVHATLKIGHGRSDDVVSQTGDFLLAVMAAFLKETLQTREFKASIEIHDLTRVFMWKP